MKNAIEKCTSWFSRFLSKGLILRIAIGGMLFIYGMGKFKMGITGFVNTVSAPFAPTLIPMIVAKGFLFAVPYIEIILGLMLLLGLFTEVAARLSALLFAIFIIGLTALEDQTNFIVILANVIYILACFKMICYNHSIFSLDHMICAKDCESCKKQTA